MDTAAARSAPSSSLASRAPDDPLPVVRLAVRELLAACPAYGELDSNRRRELANAMVRVCYAAASLIREELEGSEPLRSSTAQPVARSQSAGDGFGGAAQRVASTTRAVLNAVSFPAFVTDLINGVFRAMIESTQTQMQSYIELLNAVAASTEGFTDSHMGPASARAWLVEHYPESLEFETSVDDEDLADASPEERAELNQERAQIRVRVRPGSKPPPETALRTDLGLAPGDSVPAASDPESGLVPLVRVRLAKMRQEMLATLVQMGMQRIVIDSGRITAGMRFHIDTRDALAHDEASRFGTEHELSASGSFGIGAWGASASARSNISYVSTQKTQSTQELNTDLDLNSSVEINFKSDYLPLNRLASPGQTEAIRANSRNPDAETAASSAEREKRTADARSSESKRMASLDTLLQPTSRSPNPSTPSAPPGSAGSRAAPPRDAPSGGTPASGATVGAAPRDRGVTGTSATGGSPSGAGATARPTTGAGGAATSTPAPPPSGGSAHRPATVG